MKQTIDLNVAFESEYADSGITTIRLTLSRTTLRKLRTVMNLCEKHGLLCAELLDFPQTDYLLANGSRNENFRIGSEYFKVFRYGAVIIAENKYDPNLIIESEEICIDADLNITLPQHEEINFETEEE